MLAGAGALLALSAPAGGQSVPPGNNGTVKVDGVVFDTDPDNEPHVGCEFQVDLYGYDEGDLSATVTFQAWAPTGDRGPVLLTDELDIGEDPAGGGTDLDAEETYDLSEALAGIEPHDQQGWHVKLTIHAEGSIGADTKYKVFWVSECVPKQPTTTTTKPGSTTTVPGSTTTVPGATTTVPGATTTVPGATTTVPGGSTTTVPGGSTTVPSVSPSSSVPDTTVPSTTSTTVGDTLPITGSTTMPLVAAGVVLASIGAAVLGGLRLYRARA
jgi:hypothetical protein